jgi:hypothetical protein
MFLGFREFIIKFYALTGIPNILTVKAKNHIPLKVSLCEKKSYYKK